MKDKILSVFRSRNIQLDHISAEIDRVDHGVRSIQYDITSAESLMRRYENLISFKLFP